ncbi:MAG: chemotaxis protein CheW [Deltaproteobacteria bacterium]|nr:chemotaxis protein CheW [Deltaproteobacteria bacterium]
MKEAHEGQAAERPGDEAILRARAEALGLPIADAGAEGDCDMVLEFAMIRSRFAILLEHVEAAVKIGEIFSIPQAPPHISGIIRRRGRVIALVNLERFFRGQVDGIADADIALVVRVRGKTFALQVEEIYGVTRLPRKDVLPVPDNFDRVEARYISGVTLAGMSIVNMERLIEAEGFAARRTGA